MLSPYTVKLSRRARKALESSRGQIRARLIQALKELEIDPHQGSSKLQGRLKGLYRKRVGSYRIVIQIQDRDKTVLVLSISDRSEVYRKR